MLRFSPRPWALLLTVLSTFAVLLLSLLADVVLSNLRIYYNDNKVELTSLARWFLFNFAQYYDGLIKQMIVWFALPMLVNWATAHLRCRDENSFSIRFLLGFHLCWAALLIFGVIVALISLSPMIWLIADIRGPTSPIAHAVPYLTGLFVAISIAIVASAWWARHLHDHRLRTGLCINCGYDLRASAVQCPECGRPKEQKEMKPQISTDGHRFGI
jgi:hypothetical protein